MNKASTKDIDSPLTEAMGNLSSCAPIKIMSENPNSSVLGGDALNHRMTCLNKKFTSYENSRTYVHSRNKKALEPQCSKFAHDSCSQIAYGVSCRVRARTGCPIQRAICVVGIHPGISEYNITCTRDRLVPPFSSLRNSANHF